MEMDEKAMLHDYLRRSRASLLWKLDGLDEYDVRRPLVPSGTNLLGLVKHVASVQAGYLGDVFGRPFSMTLPWFDDDAEPNADMWVPADESRESILELHEASASHADATIAALGLDASGHVPWWGEGVTLHLILVHVIAETNRHAGHADLVRELIDGRIGLMAGNENLPDLDRPSWQAHHGRIEAAARTVAGRS